VPNINDVFVGKFLKAHELYGKRPTVTIDRVVFEPVGRAREMKAVVYFRGKDKGLILNRTNAKSVVALAGSPLTEDWPGIALTLYATSATFGEEAYDVIRIQAPTNGRPAPRIVPPPIDELDIDLQDAEIPF
jgi:hypothetical protein